MRIPVILIVTLFALSFLVDLYIAHDVKTSCRRKGWLKAYWASSVACWLFLVVILSLPRRDESAGILSIMWMLYTYLSIYLAKIGYMVCSLAGKVWRLVFRPKTIRHPARVLGVCFAILLFGVMWWGVIGTRHHIVVERVDISSPLLPASFENYTIAQISDLHVGTWGNDTTFVSALVDSVNALHPDMIVFTGDIVNRQTSELKPFIPVFSRLKAKDGVYSILGNHDYGDYVDWSTPGEREKNNRLLASYEKKMGWDLLNNQRRFITAAGDSIMLIGVENWGDPPFPTYGDMEKALSASRDSVFNQNDGRFKILLTHNPEHWNQVISKDTDIALTLTGHTHAMQMMVDLFGWKWSPARYRYEQWGGLYERENKEGKPTLMYVNIGAGEVGMPSRLLSAYPEITLFTLHR